MSTHGTVPKFGSFKPKTPVPDVPSGSNPDNGEQSRYSSEKDEKRRHHRRHHRPRSKERSRRSTELPSSLEKPKETLSTLFVVDRKGDIQNVIYGSVGRYNVPSFHRTGAGYVLGADRTQRIDRIHSEAEEIVLSNRHGGSTSGKEKYVFSRNEKKPSRLLRVRPSNDFEDGIAQNLDFMPLQRSKKSKRSESDLSISSEEEQGHYRSIEGKMKAGSQPADEALEYATESDSSGSESGRAIRYNEETRRKTVEISRKVDKHPEDIEAWLDLINHQDSLLGLGDTGYRKITNAERRSTAEIKIHMYQKALEKAGSSLENRERLLLGLMKEGAKVWDFNTHSQNWEKILQENLQSLVLWKNYLDFRQSAFQTFRYEEVRDIYFERIRLLNEAIHGKEVSEMNLHLLYEQLIYAILRTTLFMREAGFPEVGVAIWQALLEFNFLSPPTSSSPSSLLERFQEFWDSELPRIGEVGAKGWKEFQSGHDASLEEGKSDGEIPSFDTDAPDIFRDWASAESFRADTSTRPARTMDDVAEDDPYRVILWSDIEGFLIDLTPGTLSQDLRWLLVDAFLLYHRMPPIPSVQSRCSYAWWADTFVRDEISEWDRKYLKSEFPFSPLVPLALTELVKPDAQVLSDADLFAGHVSFFAGSLNTLIPTLRMSKYFVPWHCRGSSTAAAATADALHLELVSLTLQTLVKATGNESLAEYYLGFQWTNQPENIRKVAKSLLKEHPSSLRLYTAYGLIEWVRDHKDMALGIFNAALGMRESATEEERIDIIMLSKTQAWCLLIDEDRSGALRCLCSTFDPVARTQDLSAAASPARLLKVRNQLNSTRDYLLSTGEYRRSIFCTESLALLEYLSPGSDNGVLNTQGNINEALAIYDKFSAALTSRGLETNSRAHELLYQATAELLGHHIRSGPFRPALVRDRMELCLKSFPRNTIFLSLYAWNERRLRIDDRVRAMLRNVVLSEASDNLISRLFAIRHECRSGNAHSIYAALENAVSSPSIPSNPGLWRLYLLFCVDTREYRKKAKDVFYRGMRACPWAKSFMMLAFTELRSLMTFEELRSVYKVLGEKELRIHVDLEDRLEQALEKS